MTSDFSELVFNDQGLIPAIVQDRLTGEVRMMAWMNREALSATLTSGKATFFSRSRNCLWVKGETSGHVLLVEAIYADCDGDTLLVLCDPEGPSCHTGQENCFFVPLGRSETDPSERQTAQPLLGRLERVLEARRASDGEKSYTKSLFEGGARKIGDKIREEAEEVSTAISEESEERVASEAADVLFHLLVGLKFRGLDFRKVLAVLARRFGTGGHAEKASRG